MDVASMLAKAPREELNEKPESLDYADHVLQTALKGYPELAADHLLNPTLAGYLTEVVGSLCRRAALLFLQEKGDEESVVRMGRIYDVMLEIAINLYGMERLWAGFSEEEAAEVDSIIRRGLKRLEEIEKAKRGSNEILEAVIRLKIDDMKKVMARDPKGRVGMVAAMGKNVEKKLDKSNLVDSFLDAIRGEIRRNVYYVMTKEGLCRFGNDYAIGLRWLRRLGYVQVSTNPVLAAIAYRDDPSLWDKFREYLKKHPELLEDPESKADELAMAATMLALWPNMEVFRPIFFLLDYMDGMISYQLNPTVADSVEGSLKDALKIYTSTEEYFRKYDAYLLWGWPLAIERGRPNIVFKVAGSSPAAIDITRELEARGIGTNNTVVYTVSQEARLILAKMEGQARAAKMGIKVTKNYETNMGGRLEDHLREVAAADLIKKALEKAEDKEAALFKLAKKLGVPAEKPDGTWKGSSGWGYDVEAETLEEKIELVSYRNYVKKLTKPEFAEFLVEMGVFSSMEEAERELAELEEAIGLSGTLVAQRVWWLFFSPENKPKWLSWLIRKYGLSPEQAERILDSIDVLPASKRKPMDTYLTLAGNNMTNTEFPNHQLSVHKLYAEQGLKPEDYEYAVMIGHDEKYVKILYRYDDFRKAYELTPELIKVFKEAGVNVEGMGEGGLKPEEWESFGSTVKTMKGFTEGYLKFRDKCVELAKKVAAESR